MISDYKDSKPIESDNNIKVEYKKTFIEKLIDVYINNYYYFLGFLILLSSIIIIVNNKKNQFKL